MGHFGSHFWAQDHFASNHFGVVVSTQFLAQDFEVQANPAALAVTISWTAPAGGGALDYVRLVRKAYGPSATPDDGDVIYQGTPFNVPWVTDSSVEVCTPYYYTLWSKHPTLGFLVDATVRGLAFAVGGDGFFAKKLMSLMDKLYANKDKRTELGGIDQAKLLPNGQDAETGFLYNQDEDGLTLKGPLERFFKILGAEFDLIKGKIDCLPAQRDVDKVAHDFLPAMAALIGVKPNPGLSTEAQREEIKRTVASYKIRGTVKGMIAKVRAISALQAQVQEDHHHVLVTNDLTRTTPACTPAEGANRNLPGELLYYTSDDEAYSWLTFTVFVDLPATAGLETGVLEALCTTIPDFTPICRMGRLRFLSGLRSNQLNDLDGDSLDGGLLDEREELPAWGDSETETITLADSSKWVYTTPDTNTALANNVTNNPSRFTATAV